MADTQIVTDDLLGNMNLPKVDLPVLDVPVVGPPVVDAETQTQPIAEGDDVTASYLRTRREMNAMSDPAWSGSMEAGIDPATTVLDKPMFDRVETRTDGKKEYRVGVNDDDPESNLVLSIIDVTGDVAKGIGKGAVEGLTKAGKEVGETLTGGYWSENISPWLRQNIPLLPKANVAMEQAIQPVGATQEITSSITSPLTQIIGPGAFLSRTFRAAGIANKYLSEALGYGAAEIAAVAPKDGTLLEMGIQLIEDSPDIKEMLEESLGAQEDESAFVERLKNAPRRFLEGGPIGLVFERAVEGLAIAYRAIKGSPKYKSEFVEQEYLEAKKKDLNNDLEPEPEIDINTDPAPVFYSAVANAVDALPMEKGGGDQMRAMIAKSPEVKSEEMAWIGLDDFLKGKKSVTKQEIQDYVDANQVQIEEVVRADEGVTREYGELVSAYTNLPPSTSAEKAEKMLAEIKAMEADNVVGRPKFGPDSHPELSIPGGENYREVALRFPDKKAEQLFFGSHFPESNILAHVRLNDRTGPNGEKILFVEEFQSDWHQRGQKQGYQTPEQKAKLGALKAQRKKILEQRNAKLEIQTWWPRLEELQEKSIAESNDFLDGLTEAEHKEYMNLIGKRQAFDKETATALKATDSQITSMITNIPDAPLKKTWQEMSFRRVARMAAEEGYDAIAWTPGKMQAERYDLSKQISEVHLSGSNFKAYDLNGDEVINRTGVRTEDLPELIGKETADRLMSQKPKNGLRSLTGQDLQVGGKFHKDLYDKKIKQYADKWGKKFGAKVGVTDLNTGRRVDANLEVVDTPSGNFVVIDRINGGQLADFGNRQDAEAYVVGREVEATGKTMEQVWTLPITKSMKDSVLRKGVPTFGAAGLAVGMNKEVENGN